MNPLLEQRKTGVYFGRYHISPYEFACWLMDYNRRHGSNIRPSKATAAMFGEFLKFQRLVKRVGYVQAVTGDAT